MIMEPPLVSVEDETENIRVYLRLKPLQEGDIPANHLVCSDNSIWAKGEPFVFDAIGGQEIGQEEVWTRVAQPIADNCLQGFNGTIFAYGQTGSGKTFTMQGHPPLQPGIIPRTLEYLFGRMRGDEGEWEVRLSFVEIYNECIFDLLDPHDAGGSGCQLRETREGLVYVEDCTMMVTKVTVSFRV